MIALLFLIPAVILGGIGALLLKKGSKTFSFNLKALNKHIILGVLLFGFSMMLYIPALSYGNLSVIYPLSSFSYVVVAFLSVKYLGEKMSTKKWLGVIFIIAGAFLLVI